MIAWCFTKAKTSWATVTGLIGFEQKRETEKLRREIKQLRADLSAAEKKRADRDSARPDGVHGYVLLDGKTEPYCPKCFWGDDRIVPLGPQRGVGKVRTCSVCSFAHTEDPDAVSAQRTANMKALTEKMNRRSRWISGRDL